MLTLDRLRFAYPKGRAAYEFTMSARAGEITAVSGASGAGKSTLLDLIAGFLAPADGTIELDGHDLVPLPPEKRPVSILLQSEILFEHLTVRRNLALGLPHGTGRAAADEAIARALAETELPGLEERRASSLSGGQKQRVALARTLLRARPVLLLDEPFSALDDDTRTTVRTLVGQLTARHGWHTILVSHHADDVSALATRGYRLAGGGLMENGGPGPRGSTRSP
jgi:thiamine transport system ATP-binding protein